MLYVKSISASQIPTFELDGYTISVYFQKLLSPIYWRTGAKTNSIVEIGLDPTNGGLISTTIVLANQVVYNQDSDKNPAFLTPNNIGLPMCHIRLRQHNDFYIEDDGYVAIYVTQQQLAINFVAEAKPIQLLKSDRILFGLDENNCLNAIYFSEITDKELSLIKHALHIK